MEETYVTGAVIQYILCNIVGSRYFFAAKTSLACGIYTIYMQGDFYACGLSCYPICFTL